MKLSLLHFCVVIHIIKLVYCIKLINMDKMYMFVLNVWMKNNYFNLE